MCMCEELVALLGRSAYVCVCSVCVYHRPGQMVHKGVTTQWVGTAIDALQHPRRWNIWLLTRSQNSLALPSPYLAAAREPTGDSVGINIHSRTQHFPTLKGAWAARRKLLPRLCKEVTMVVQAGIMSARSHGDEQRRSTGTYCVTLGWRRSDLELILKGPLLVQQLHMRDM